MADPKPITPPMAEPMFPGNDMPEYLATQLREDLSQGLQPPDFTPWDIAGMFVSPGQILKGAANKALSITGKGVGKDFLKMAGKTAIARKGKLSKPTKELLDEFKQGGLRVLHHGSGQAQADTEAIRKFKNVVDEYDVNFAPDRSILGKEDYDRVISNYVLNVLPEKERADAITDIASSLRPGGKGMITVRGKGSKIVGTPEVGGVITKKKTYQKTFSPQELQGELSQYFDDVKIIRGTDKSDSLTAQVSGKKKWYQVKGGKQ